MFLLGFLKSSLPAMWDLLVLLFLVFIKIVSILYVSYKTVVDCLVIFFERKRGHSSCLTSFLSFYELFCNCANVIGNLRSVWSGVSILSPCPFLFLAADSSLPQWGTSFCRLNFILSAVVILAVLILNPRVWFLCLWMFRRFSLFLYRLSTLFKTLFHAAKIFPPCFLLFAFFMMLSYVGLNESHRPTISFIISSCSCIALLMLIFSCNKSFEKSYKKSKFLTLILPDLKKQIIVINGGFTHRKIFNNVLSFRGEIHLILIKHIAYNIL